MQCLTRKSFLGLTAIALCVGLSAPAARADLVGFPVLPNTTPVTPSPNAPGNLANEIRLGIDPVNTSFNSTSIFANLANAVFRNSAGFIDILFQLRNEANSVPISSIDVSNYGGFVTGGGYITAGELPANTAGVFVEPTGSGTLTPSLVSRTNTTVSFEGFNILAGSTSNIFFVTTNATSFNQLGAALASATSQDSGAATFSTKFQPTAAVPEASTVVMSSLMALMGTGYAWRKRKRATV
jgi:hypothetical protein